MTEKQRDRLGHKYTYSRTGRTGTHAHTRILARTHARMHAPANVESTNIVIIQKRHRNGTPCSNVFIIVPVRVSEGCQSAVSSEEDRNTIIAQTRHRREMSDS